MVTPWEGRLRSAVDESLATKTGNRAPGIIKTKMADSGSKKTVLNTKALNRVASLLLEQVENQEQDNATTIEATKSQAGDLVNAAIRIARSHSGSNFGYHGALYYREFEVPSLHSMFNVEWGGIRGIPAGWRKREPEEVKIQIESWANITCAAVEYAIKAPLDSAKRSQREILIQLAPLHQLPDNNRERQLLDSLEHFDWKDSAEHDYSVASVNGYPKMTRDSAAISQGVMLTSHNYYEAVATQVEKSCEAVEAFWTLAKRLLRQLQLAETSAIVIQEASGDGGNLAARYERLKLGVSLAAAFLLSLVIAAVVEYAIRKWRWEWLLSHPNSYSIQWLSYIVLLLFLVGLFVRRFRNYCWGFALVPLVVGVLQLLGGPPRKA